MLPDNSVKELSELQLNRAKELIKFIPGFIELGDYNSVVNRAYYAAFHAIKSIELLDDFDSKKHSGVIAFFRLNYIKTGIIDSEYSKIIGRLQEARESSDYDVMANFTLQDAHEMYEIAKEFVNAIEKYLNEKSD